MFLSSKHPFDMRNSTGFYSYEALDAQSRPWTTVTSRAERSSDNNSGELDKVRSKSNTGERAGPVNHNRELYSLPKPDVTSPQRPTKHSYNPKNHSGNGSRNNDRFYKSNEKFALNWARVRADNGSIFVRKTDSPMDQRIKSSRKEEDKNNASRVTPHQSGLGQDFMTEIPTKDHKENGRPPLKNMWTDVKRKRKVLRDKALKESLKRNNVSKQQANGFEHHQPFVNDISKVTRLYTNMTIAADQLRKSRIPNDTNASGVTLNRREAAIYLKITKAYDDSTEREKRQQIFYRRLGEIQERSASQKRADLARMEHERENALKRQEQQLKMVRERYNADRMRRFTHQHVSNKVIDSESSDRHMYGLPEEYGESRSPDFKKRREKNTERPPKEERKKKNIKTFGYLFPNRPKLQQRRPKMEGLDTVVIVEANDNGEGTVAREREVKSVIKEARDYLHRDPVFSDDDETPNTKSKEDKIDGLSEASLDLDEEELFERARKKYQIDLDSDDDEEEDSVRHSRFL